MVVNCAGATIWITPPHEHISFDEFCSAGCPPISTVGEPGTHGAAVTGRQGMGVSTPSAAAVAAATIGLPMHMHVPKGITLTIGRWSITVAAGAPDSTAFSGSTPSVPGAAPKLHCSVVPAVT